MTAWKFFGSPFSSIFEDFSSPSSPPHFYHRFTQDNNGNQFFFSNEFSSSENANNNTQRQSNNFPGSNPQPERERNNPFSHIFSQVWFFCNNIMRVNFREQTILITTITAMLTTTTKKETTCSSAAIAATAMDKIASEILSQNLIVNFKFTVVLNFN